MIEQTTTDSAGLTTKTIQGCEFPTVGFGTFKLSGDQCRKAVSKALQTGYRHIDTARVYQNEEAVGSSIQDTKLDRRKIFLTSKVWRDDLSPADIHTEVEASLRALRTEYLDLVLIHWPNPDYPVKESIEAFQELKNAGKIHRYGVSNFTPTLFKEAAQYGEIFCNQVEYHPLLGQSRLLDVLRGYDSALIAYSPLAQGDVLGYPELHHIAEKHGKTSGQIALRWLIEQESVLAIPRSSNPRHIESNLDVFDFQLDDSDREKIAALPKDQRKINPDFAPQWENDHDA